MRIISKTQINNIVYLLIGALLLSRISAYLSLDILKLPYYSVEVLLLPFIPFIYSRYSSFLTKFIKYNLLKIVVIIFSIILIILYSHIFNIYGTRYILATARGYLYIFLFMLLGLKMKEINIKNIYFLSLGSLISSYIWLQYNPIYMGETYYINLTALYLCVLIPILRNRYLEFVLILLMSSYVGVLTGLRRTLFVIIVACAIGILTNIIIGKWKLKIAYLTLIGFIILFYERIILFVFSFAEGNEYLFKRIVIKSIDSNVGDQRRLQELLKIGNIIVDNYYPSGFLAKAPDVTGSGLFMDLPFYELNYTFGSIIVIPMLLIIIYKVTNYCLKLLYHNVEKIKYIIPYTVIILISFLFIDGGFLCWTYQTVFTGLFIGLLFNKKILVYYK